MVNYGAIFDTIGKGVGNLADGVGKAKNIKEQKKGMVENQGYLEEQTGLMSDDYSTAMNPYIEGGEKSYDTIQGLDSSVDNYDPMMDSRADYGFQFDGLEETPAYKFRMQQGLQGLDQSASGDGSLFSGGQQKATMDYAQNLASQEYDNQYNRDFSAFQDANNQFQDARNYNTGLDQQNYQNELGQNQYLANMGYQANTGLADTNLALQQANAQGQMGLTSGLADAEGARLQNIWGTVGDQNRIAGQGAKDYFSMGMGSGGSSGGSSMGGFGG